jgi:menaquinone-dependent protoporphyrinogen oxidase
MVADALREEGFSVDVAPAGTVGRVEGYDAVIVGGALYAMRWHREARRFVQRHAAALRSCPTYLFSSGPLDDSAAHKEIPPVRGVRVLMDQVGARGHVTFGGRLSAHARGYPASAMAKRNPGDWRNPQQVRRWADVIAGELLSGRGASETRVDQAPTDPAQADRAVADRGPTDQARAGHAPAAGH